MPFRTSDSGTVVPRGNPLDQLPTELRIAGVRFVLRNQAPIRFSDLADRYRPFLKAAAGGVAATVAIVVRQAELSRFRDLRRLWNLHPDFPVFEDDGGFLWVKQRAVGARPPVWAARFDRRVRQAALFVDAGASRALARGGRAANPLSGGLDQALLIYRLASRRTGFLIHATGARIGGRGFVFCGRSGAGKSTLAKLMMAREGIAVLSDERVAVRTSGTNWRVHGSPWASRAGVADSGSAPIEAIFFLKHGRTNRVLRLGAGQTLERLLPVATVPWSDPAALRPVLDLCGKLIADVPAFEFQFRPEPKAVDRLLDLVERRP
jgi:hypothetical protein